MSNLFTVLSGDKKCPVGQFLCTNKKCIDNTLLCNEEDDCGDNSDESGCGEPSFLFVVNCCGQN